MIRWLIAGLLVAGLAIGVWMLWPTNESSPSSTTIGAIDTTTSTKPSDPSTTATEPATSTSAAHVVTTVAEAEAILADLWFGWFEGIYNQDEARIKEVVGSQAMLDDARGAFGAVPFIAAPSLEGVVLLESEILKSSEECLAIWVTSQATFVDGQTGPLVSVEVLRQVENKWKFVSTWRYRNDLWEADCESSLEPLS